MNSQRAQIKGVKETLKQYPDRPLIGVFNIETKEIVLFPCFEPLLELVEDEKGNFVSGSLMLGYKNSQITRGRWPHNIVRKLDPQELENCNRLGFAARFTKISADSEYKNLFTPGDESQVSSHGFVVRLMGIKDLAAISKLRGFTVTRNKGADVLSYKWNSGCLNSKRDPNTHQYTHLVQNKQGVRTFLRITEMSDGEQWEVRNILRDINKEMLQTEKDAEYWRKAAVALGGGGLGGCIGFFAGKGIIADQAAKAAITAYISANLFIAACVLAGAGVVALLIAFLINKYYLSSPLEAVPATPAKLAL